MIYIVFGYQTDIEKEKIADKTLNLKINILNHLNYKIRTQL